MSKKELLKKLIELGAREFNLEEGFSDFECLFVATIGNGIGDFFWVNILGEQIKFTIEFGTAGVGEIDKGGDFEIYESVYYLI